MHNIHYIIYTLYHYMHAYKLYYCNTVHVIFITVHVFCIPSFMQSYFCTLCQPESPGAKSHWKSCAKQVALKQGISSTVNRAWIKTMTADSFPLESCKPLVSAMIPIYIRIHYTYKSCTDYNNCQSCTYN